MDNEVDKDDKKASKNINNNIHPYHYKFTHNDDQCLTVSFIAGPGSGKSYFIFMKCIPMFIKKNNKDAYIIIFSESLGSPINKEYRDNMKEYKNVFIYDEYPSDCDVYDYITSLTNDEDESKFDQIIKSGKESIEKIDTSCNYFYDKKNEENKFLVIFDDFPLIDKKIDRLFREKRHINCSIFIGTQSMHDYSKKWKAMIQLFCFRGINGDHVKQYHDQFVESNCHLDEFMYIYDQICKEKHGFLCVQPYNPEQFITLDFERLLKSF